MKNSNKPICGAKAKQTGKPCEKSPLKGKTRCRLHGGATPKGKNVGAANGNYSKGLYVTHLTDRQREMWSNVPLGKVDDELRLCRVMLDRALELDKEIAKNPHSVTNTAGLEVSEIRQSESPDSSRTDTIIRRPDLSTRIDRLIGRIALLEKVRIDIVAAESGKPGVDVRYVVQLPAQVAMEDWQQEFRPRLQSDSDLDKGID